VITTLPIDVNSVEGDLETKLSGDEGGNGKEMRRYIPEMPAATAGKWYKGTPYINCLTTLTHPPIPRSGK
jgi:hypothetical protein